MQWNNIHIEYIKGIWILKRFTYIDKSRDIQAGTFTPVIFLSIGFTANSYDHRIRWKNYLHYKTWNSNHWTQHSALDVRFKISWVTDQTNPIPKRFGFVRNNPSSVNLASRTCPHINEQQNRTFLEDRKRHVYCYWCFLSGRRRKFRLLSLIGSTIYFLCRGIIVEI